MAAAGRPSCASRWAQPERRRNAILRRTTISCDRMTQYAAAMLHVANGDHALSVLRSAGLPGEVTAWSDVLDQGPVRGPPGTDEFRTLRAEWLAEHGAG